mmetsp:Transcript_1061/g.1855  ORF Transcript_1061/g.1855 Transcript_1061/m.1855 type:complete len:107 (+) Transcript_1061:213-533(+)
MVAIVPTTANIKPPIMNNQSVTFSQTGRCGPNSFKCAAAGKTTLTSIEQINPTREQRKLNDGMNIATKSADTINVNLIKLYDISITLSVGINGAIISSTPNASGKM